MEEDVFSEELDDFSDSVSHNYDVDRPVRPRLESRMSVCLPSKGLYNAPGENNCFLNAAVQVLWHLNVFRRSFRLLDGHACLENACVFCALKRIFQEFQDSDAVALAPDDLRQAMANAFMDERRFQLGRMYDAAECFENILIRLHSHITTAEFADTCSAKHCIPHQKFALHILEQTSCRCLATGEPKSFYQFVHYVSASALIQYAGDRTEGDITFGELLKRTSQVGVNRPCPDEQRCLYKENPLTSVQTTLINCPDVVTIGIIWDTDRPSANYVTEMLNCLGETLYLIDLFDNIPDEEQRGLELKLAGVVTYYGKHYTSFFYNIREQQWIYFDDAKVQAIGPYWNSVKTKCRRSRFQPLLIVYSNATGVPVDVSCALKTVEIVSKETLLAEPPTSQVGHHKKQHNSHRSHRSRRSPSRPDSPIKSNLSTPEKHSFRMYSGSPQRNLMSPPPRSPKPENKFQDNFQNNVNNKNFVNDLKNRNMYNHEGLTQLNVNQTFPGHSYKQMDVEKSFVIQPSSSNNSIKNMAKNKNIVDKTDAPNRWRSGSIKKKLGTVMKNMLPYKDMKQNSIKNYVIPTSRSLDEISYADVGFTSPILTSKTIEQSTPTKQDVNRLDKSKQHQNLEHHQQMLNKYFNSENPDRSKTPNHQDLNNSVNSEDAENKLREIDLNVEELEGVDPDLIHFHSRPEVIITLNTNTYPQTMPNNATFPNTNMHPLSAQGEFERLVGKGDGHMTVCDRYEKEGDILLSLHWCTEATKAFRDACKVVGISDSLVKFIDEKRWNSLNRSRMLQRKADLVINGDLSDNLTQPPANISNGRDTRELENLYTLQNINGKQALNRVNRDIKTESSSRNRKKPNGNVCSNAAQTFQDTSICWVVDKRNDNLITTGGDVNKISQSTLPMFYQPKSESLPNKNMINKGLVNRGLPNMKNDIIRNKNRVKSIYDNVEDPEFVLNSYDEKNDKNTSQTIYDNVSIPPAHSETISVNRVSSGSVLKAKKLIDKLNNPAPPVDSEKTHIPNTLDKLNKRGIKKPRCAQCGWKIVEVDGQFCEKCQSEFL